jgi:hypothetical protein
VVAPHVGLATEDLELGLQRLDALAAVVDLGGDGVLTDRDAGARGVEQADRLVRELAGGDVAVPETDGRSIASSRIWTSWCFSKMPATLRIIRIAGPRRARRPARSGSAG